MAYKFQRGEAILSGALLQEGNIEIEEGFSFSMHEETIVDTSRNLTVVGISGSANLQAGGALTVAGASDLNGALDVAGASTLAAASFSGVIDANSTSDFQGAMNLQAAITVAGDADLNAGLDVAGAASLAASTVLTDIRGTLSVDEAAVFDDALTVLGASTLAAASFSGVIDANSTSDFQGAMNLQDTLAVAGASTLAGASFSGAIDANSTSDFAGAMNLQDTLAVTGASTMAAITAAGAIELQNASVQFSGIVDTVFDIAADSMYYLDATDSSLKSRDWASIVAQLAGPGLGVTNGQLSTSGNDVHLKASGSLLQEGYNYFADIVADAGVTLPAAPTVGDVVHIKAGNITGDDVEITVTKGSVDHRIDGDEAIYLESPFAAVSLVYVVADAWRIV